ncbi:MAG: bifunctional DNA-formamidopyrimidine glycosylase/DNA-(apurinic or apyrimidinic site) lyase [Gammaproteobacteria bacterium]|nr:bifunctional DNA-formamidopyrimidine glycosylase/DNA-(apurinic or apyrimidinic site) lyase [Gammaproteobacteria bacterium]
MPELPEVETARRGIEPHLLGQRIERLVVREPRLRLPVPSDLAGVLAGRVIEEVNRRGKYLLIRVSGGTIILHLGMSGSLRIVSPERPAERHDHVDLVLANGVALRFTDPRRFGLLVWTTENPLKHPLLAHLGPEPLDAAWDGAALWAAAKGKRVAIKGMLMDANVVVGVGNIYANESLFMAGIHPGRAAGRISLPRYLRLADAVKEVLSRSIEQGGTTLRDFVAEDGRPGYFSQSLKIYGRSDQPCLSCGGPIREIRQFGRATYYCPACQR